jgi:predicted RND superfamily exporter protein
MLKEAEVIARKITGSTQTADISKIEYWSVTQVQVESRRTRRDAATDIAPYATQTGQKKGCKGKFKDVTVAGDVVSHSVSCRRESTSDDALSTGAWIGIGFAIVVVVIGLGYGVYRQIYGTWPYPLGHDMTRVPDSTTEHILNTF